jgi:hypothetical protein
MKRLHSFAAIAATLIVVGAADAQRGPGPGGPPMPRGMMAGGFGGGGFGLLQFDANNDGKLTRAEFDAGQKARFNEADANKDGFIAPEEMRASMMKRRADMRFASMDTDHNGQISKAEFEAATTPKLGGPDGGPLHGWGGRPHFARFGGPDGRGGGPGMTGPRGRGPGGQGPGGQGPAGQGPDGHGPGGFLVESGGGAPKDGSPVAKPGDAAQRVHRMGPADANGDGKLSYEEFAARGSAEFTRADTNKDGVVTIAELRAFAGVPR